VNEYIEEIDIDIHDRVAEAYRGELGERLMIETQRRLHWICDNIKGQKILDIGCSQGILPILLGREGREVVGVDISKKAIDEAESALLQEKSSVRQNINFLRADFLSYDFKDRQFDTIIIAEVLEHLQDPQQFIDRAKDLLVENGKLIITVPFGINDHVDHKHTFYLLEPYRMLFKNFNVEQIEIMGKWIAFVGVLRDNSESACRQIDCVSVQKVESSFFDIERELVDKERLIQEKLRQMYENKRANRKKYDLLVEKFNAFKTKSTKQKQEIADKEREMHTKLENLYENKRANRQKYDLLVEKFNAFKTKSTKQIEEMADTEQALLADLQILREQQQQSSKKQIFLSEMVDRYKAELEQKDICIDRYMMDLEDKNIEIERLKNIEALYKSKIKSHRVELKREAKLLERSRRDHQDSLNSLSYKLGHLLLHETKNLKSLILLPKKVLSMKKERAKRGLLSSGKGATSKNNCLDIETFLQKVTNMLDSSRQEVEDFIEDFMKNCIDANYNEQIYKKLFVILKDTHVELAVKYGKIYIDNNMDDIAFGKIFAFRLKSLDRYSEAYHYFQSFFSMQDDEQIHQEILKHDNKEQITSWISLAKLGELELLDRELNELLDKHISHKDRIYRLVGYALTNTDVDLSIKYIKRAIQIKSSRILNLKLFDLYIRQGNISLAIDTLADDSSDVATLKKSRWRENLSLISKDFPLPNRSLTDLNTKNNSSILYLLHSTLPYHSGGYATRAHGLMEGVNSLNDFTMIGVSRLSYPKDILKLPSFLGIDDNEEIGKIRYTRLKSNVNFSNSSYIQYIERYAQEVCRVASKESPLLIHAASNFYNALAAIQAARVLGLKSIYEIRGLWEITRVSREQKFQHTELYSLNMKLEVEAAKSADVVLSITEALKTEMVKHGVDADKIRVLPNGVDTDRFIPLDKDEDLVDMLNVKDRVVIGYIGSIVHYEGLDYLVRAFKLLVDSGIKNSTVLIVGDGVALDGLKELVAQLSLDEYFIFTGRVAHDEVERYYSIVDIAPFPRKSLLVTEMVSPLKPFEAMSMAKAVISSDVAALAEIVKSGHNGIVFKKDSVEDLSIKLKTLIEDEELRSSLGREAREWVKKERDWRVIAKKLNKIYQDIHK